MGRRFFDTPGLDDTKLRIPEAEAITNALKKKGTYRLFFIMVFQNGRMRSEDITTMKLVLGAAKSEIKNDSFGIIVNQLSEGEFQLMEKDREKNLKDIQESLFTDKELPSTSHIFFNRRSQDLADASDVVTQLPRETRAFIDGIKGVEVAEEKVNTINAANWENMLKTEHELKAAAEDAQRRIAEMTKKAKEDQRIAADLLQEQRKTLSAEAAREMEENLRKMKEESDKFEGGTRRECNEDEKD